MAKRQGQKKARPKAKAKEQRRRGKPQPRVKADEREAYQLLGEVVVKLLDESKRGSRKLEEVLDRSATTILRMQRERKRRFVDVIEFLMLCKLRGYERVWDCLELLRDVWEKVPDPRRRGRS